MDASNVVPPIVALLSNGNVLKNAAGNAPKSDLLGNLSKENDDRLKKLFEGLNLEGIQLWT